MNLLNLDETLIIANELRGSDLLNFCQANKLLNRLVCNNDKFWLNKYLKDCPNRQIPKKLQGETWREFYLRNVVNTYLVTIDEDSIILNVERTGSYCESPDIKHPEYITYEPSYYDYEWVNVGKFNLTVPDMYNKVFLVLETKLLDDMIVAKIHFVTTDRERATKKYNSLIDQGIKEMQLSPDQVSKLFETNRMLDEFYLYTPESSEWIRYNVVELKLSSPN